VPTQNDAVLARRRRRVQRAPGAGTAGLIP